MTICALKTTTGASRRSRGQNVSESESFSVVVPSLEGPEGSLGLAGQRFQQGAWGRSSRAARGAQRHHGSQNESQAVSHFPAGSASQSRSETCVERQPKSERDRKRDRIAERGEGKDRAVEQKDGGGEVMDESSIPLVPR